MITRLLACAGLGPGLGLGLALVPALPPAPAAAASFDCARAATAYERAICDSADLSALDETLAVAFATAIGGLSKTATATMRANQRAWIGYAERACTADAEPQRADYTEDQSNCLHSNLYNRIRDLEESRMEGGWRFYMVEDFRVMPADTEEFGADFITIATKVYASPRIDGTDDTAVAFNDFAAAVLARAMAGAIEGGGPDDRASDVDTRVKVAAATPSRITLETTDWWYGHGAAHGNYTITYDHFLPDEGRALVAADLFAGDDWVAPVAALAHDALVASFGGALWEDLDDAMRDWVADPSRWSFSEQGLGIRFQPYEVTAYAAGAPTITLPWAQLEAWTSDAVFRLAY